MCPVREVTAALSQQCAVQVFVLATDPRGRLQTLWAVWREGLGCRCMEPPVRDIRDLTLEKLLIECLPFQKAHAVGGEERVSREHAG
jgi:hypothetical protein